MATVRLLSVGEVRGAQVHVVQEGSETRVLLEEMDPNSPKKSASFAMDESCGSTSTALSDIAPPATEDSFCAAVASERMDHDYSTKSASFGAASSGPREEEDAADKKEGRSTDLAAEDWREAASGTSKRQLPLNPAFKITILRSDVCSSERQQGSSGSNLNRK